MTPQQGNARVEGTFILGAVNITGATVFSSEELAKSFEPYLASRVGQAELNKIVADITDRYRRAGYFLSYAVLPEQTVSSGIVHIRVVEGFISEVRIEGQPRISRAARRIAERLKGDRPLRAESLERTLAIIRALPDVTVKDASISRSVDNPRLHTLTIVLSANEISGIAYADNRGMIPGARLRAYSSISAGSVFTSGDQFGVDLFAIPSDNFRYLYGQAKMSVPLDSDGTRFALSASRGDQFQRTAAGSERGNSHQFAGEFVFALAQSRALQMSGHFSMSDWLSEERRGGALVQRDQLDVARAWLDITHVSTTRIDARIGISQGLDIGFGTEPGDPRASRPYGTAKFTKFNADVQVIAPLTSRIYLRGDTTAQLSTTPLLEVEEFALGGSRVGRAYDYNSATGDSGFGAMAEIDYRVGEPKHGSGDLTLFVYGDGGAAFRIRPSPGLPRHQWLASLGTGARFTMRGISWSGELGLPVHFVGPGDQVRAFFSAARAF